MNHLVRHYTGLTWNKSCLRYPNRDIECDGIDIKCPREKSLIVTMLMKIKIDHMIIMLLGKGLYRC